MTEVGEVFAEKPYAIAIQQGSHLQDDLSGVFIATLFGLALAMITLVGEVIYYRRKRQNETKRKFEENES
ncbi:hypothetical protein NQ317_006415 [Molorchus minor]|uniref:Uncharacterized protein n=1 Tax=Molorchus minor TaxID=1323400 RepID=A0ABQ9K026_9CUCU|nr:hypothetical protein NQ317_006415 [Molorchus minor]